MTLNIHSTDLIMGSVHHLLRMFQTTIQKYDNLDHMSSMELRDFDWRQWFDIHSSWIDRYHNLWQQLKKERFCIDLRKGLILFVSQIILRELDCLLTCSIVCLWTNIDNIRTLYIDLPPWSDIVIIAAQSTSFVNVDAMN